MLYKLYRIIYTALKIRTELNLNEIHAQCYSRVMTGRSNEAEIKPKINCARKKKSDGLSDRVDFFATTVQKKKEARIQVSIMVHGSSMVELAMIHGNMGRDRAQNYLISMVS